VSFFKTFFLVLVFSMLVFSQSAYAQYCETMPPSNNPNSVTQEELENLGNQLYDKEWVLTWASVVAIKAMTFGSHDYLMRFQDGSNSFKSRAWKAFLESLSQDNFMEDIKDKQVTISASISSVPIVQGEGLYEGVYSWDMQIPLVVSVVTNGETKNLNKLAIVNVVRTVDPSHKRGLAISKWTLKDR